MQFSYADTIRRRLARLAAKPKQHDMERHHAEILRHMRENGITGDDSFLTAAQSLGIGARPSPRPRAEMGLYEARVSYLRSAPPQRREVDEDDAPWVPPVPGPLRGRPAFYMRDGEILACWPGE